MTDPDQPHQVVPAIDRDAPTERLWLDRTSWVDVVRGWITHPEAVTDALVHQVPWSTSRLYRYDHAVEERRLGASWSVPRPAPHPVIVEAHRTLQHRYGVRFEGCGMIQYRDGRDGQGFHRDTDMRWLDDTLIAIATFGATRPWVLRPRNAPQRDRDAPGRGAVHDLAPASGDLLVMGGRCQADWEHAVPYLGATPTAPRVSLQWRWARKAGRPHEGPGYRAPRRYGDRRRSP